MTKENLINHTFSHEELCTLQTFIGQEVEVVYVSQEDDKFYDKLGTMIEVCFKPQLLIKFSNGYYIFSNHVITNRANEEVCKVAFSKFSDTENKVHDQYDRIFDLPLLSINKIEIYSTLDIESDPEMLPFRSLESWKLRREKKDLYGMISDSLIIMEDFTGEKIAIAAWPFFQGSIRFYSDTISITSELLTQTFGHHGMPMFHKRVEISKSKIEYL